MFFCKKKQYVRIFNSQLPGFEAPNRSTTSALTQLLPTSPLCTAFALYLPKVFNVGLASLTILCFIY